MNELKHDRCSALKIEAFIEENIKGGNANGQE